MVFLTLSLSLFTGVDFKMKTLLIDGIKVRIQIWYDSSGGANTDGEGELHQR